MPADLTPSKVSRVERAKQSASDADVLAYCEVSGASDEVTAGLRQEPREIRIEAASWKRQLRTGHGARQEYNHQIEHGAGRIRLFEVALVPSLVQTAEYARYVFEAATELHQAPRDTDDAVQGRMARQSVLYDSNTDVEIVCSEAALRHPNRPRTEIARINDEIPIRDSKNPTATPTEWSRALTPKSWSLRPALRL